MLVLSRKKNESFVVQVGDDVIHIKVNKIGLSPLTGKREVQFGIEAPREYKVWRTEIYEAIQENKKATENPAVSSEQLRGLLGGQE